MESKNLDLSGPAANMWVGHNNRVSVTNPTSNSL